MKAMKAVTGGHRRGYVHGRNVSFVNAVQRIGKSRLNERPVNDFTPSLKTRAP